MRQNIYPVYPNTLQKKLEQIYFNEIAPTIKSKVKELSDEGKRIFNLKEKSFIDDIKVWVTSFLFWHKNKIKRMTNATNIFLKNDVDDFIIDRFVVLNVDLITDLSKTIQQHNFGDVLKRIISNGKDMSQSSIVEEIMRQTLTDKNKAKFWARDQVAKLNSDVDKYKYESSGVEYYVWLASLDSRTRAEHRDLHGKLRKLGEGLHPGEDYNCRCTMKPATDEEIFRGGLEEEYLDRARKRWREV